MGNKGTIRKVLSIVAIIGQLGFFLFSFFFYWPAMWYFDGGIFETVGGIYQYCTKVKVVDEWTCHDVDEDVADSWDHSWGAYIAMRAFVSLAHLVGLITIILFYVHLCVKNKIVGFVNAMCAAVQWLFILIAVAIATGTFDEIGAVDADPAYALILAWLSWIGCFGIIALSVAILFVIIKDD